jgi:hypothetical protein
MTDPDLGFDWLEPSERTGSPPYPVEVNLSLKASKQPFAIDNKWTVHYEIGPAEVPR